MTTTTPIRCREDGILEKVNGPLYPTYPTRELIAGRMGWTDSGEAAPVISATLALLAEGKSVRLTSHYGYTVIQPLADDEDGRSIPRSAATVYRPDGSVYSRTV